MAESAQERARLRRRDRGQHFGFTGRSPKAAATDPGGARRAAGHFRLVPFRARPTRVEGAHMADPSRVLVVQAEDAERLFQRALFVDAGMSVFEATTGSEALDYLATDRPDLVVLGRTLPDMDGLELLPRLKSSELDFVPVLVASHRGETSERVRGLQLGADDYIGRPCDPAELLARAKALLRNKQTHDKIRKLHVALEQMVVSDPL